MFWSIYGNSGVLNSEFLGTSIDVDFAVHRNNEVAFRVYTGGAIVFTGNTTTGIIPISGAGVRLVWSPQNKALCAGQAIAASWDVGNIGGWSAALGMGTQTAPYGTAIGNLCTIPNTVNAGWSAVIGDQTTIDGTDATDSVATGRNCHMTGQFVTTSWSEGEDNTITDVNASDCHVEGRSNVVAATYGAFCEGYDNTINATADVSHTEGSGNANSGDGAHAEGLNNTVTSGGAESHVEGESCTTNGNWGHAEGYQTTAGTNSHAEGVGCVASGQGHAEGFNCNVTTAVGITNLHAGGAYAKPSSPHEFARGSGRFGSTTGSAQFSILHLSVNTLTSAQTELAVLPASSRYPVLTNNSCYGVTGYVVGRCSATDYAVYQISFVCYRGASAATTVVSGLVKTVIHEVSAAWDVTVTADTTNGRFAIKVTGENPKAINWTAHLNLVKTGF